MKGDRICDPVRDKLVEYCEGELQDHEIKKITDHITTCDACREYAEDVRNGFDALTHLPEVRITDSEAKVCLDSALEIGRRFLAFTSSIAEGSLPSVALHLTSIDIKEWSIEGIDRTLSLLDVYIEFRRSDGTRTYALLISEEGKRIHFYLPGYSMAASKSHWDRVSGMLIFLNGDMQRFHLIETKDRLVLHLPTLQEGLTPMTLRAHESGDKGESAHI